MMARQAADIEERLNHAVQLLNEALQCVASLKGRIEERQHLEQAEVTYSVDAVERLADEQMSTIKRARHEGQGAGLYKVLDEAAELDQEAKRLVSEIKQDGVDPEQRREFLERFWALEKEQEQMLMTELGKFEAQGLRHMLDEFLALGEQQGAIIRQLMARG